MMAYEMVGISDHNSRTYESKYGTYNKETGFVLNEVGRSLGKCELLDRMFHENCWSMKTEPKPKKMTKEEFEKELGYEIEIDDGHKVDDGRIIDENGRIRGFYRNDDELMPVKDLIEELLRGL